MEVLQSAGQNLREALPWVAETAPIGSKLKASWYLSPEQHIVEDPASVVVMVAWLVYQIRTNPWTVQLRANKNTNQVYVADSTMAVLAVACFTAQVVFKSVNNRLPFMFQPCHILTAMLVFLSFSPPKSKIAGYVFNLYLHSVYAPWLALLKPDVRDLKLPYEILVFFVHHLLLVLAPFYFIFRRRFPVVRPQLLSCWIMMYIYHLGVANGISLLTGCNISYMTHPPNVGVFTHMGRYYRVIMGCACLPLTFLARCVITEVGARLLSLRTHDPEHALIGARRGMSFAYPGSSRASYAELSKRLSTVTAMYDEYQASNVQATVPSTEAVASERSVAKLRVGRMPEAAPCARAAPTTPKAVELKAMQAVRSWSSNHTSSRRKLEELANSPRPTSPATPGLGRVPGGKLSLPWGLRNRGGTDQRDGQCRGSVGEVGAAGGAELFPDSASNSSGLPGSRVSLGSVSPLVQTAAGHKSGWLQQYGQAFRTALSALSLSPTVEGQPAQNASVPATASFNDLHTAESGVRAAQSTVLNDLDSDGVEGAVESEPQDTSIEHNDDDVVARVMAHVLPLINRETLQGTQAIRLVRALQIAIGVPVSGSDVVVATSSPGLGCDGEVSSSASTSSPSMSVGRLRHQPRSSRQRHRRGNRRRYGGGSDNNVHRVNTMDLLRMFPSNPNVCQGLTPTVREGVSTPSSCEEEEQAPRKDLTTPIPPVRQEQAMQKTSPLPGSSSSMTSSSSVHKTSCATEEADAGAGSGLDL